MTVRKAATNLDNQSRYKWYMLILAALTGALALAAPGMSLSVLFSEISSNLKLSVLQLGWIWGIGALPGIVSSILGGAIIDRFGPKRVMATTLLLLGFALALRGIAYNFASLMAAALLVGALSPLISTSAIKICGIWFPHRQWGLANGVFTLGMAAGFLVGSLISATVLSPLLGGWRQVMVLYGALCLALVVPWVLSRARPVKVEAVLPAIPIGKSMTHILKQKNIWLLGIAMLGIGGCMSSMTGYLPFYLQGQGWNTVSADGALSLLHALSMTFVLPLTIASDRLNARKLPLVGMFFLMITGNALLTVAHGWTVWLAVVLGGIVRDATMALLFTMAVECEGVGPAYAGTAAGFMVSCNNLGSVIASPTGNQLANVSAGLPFAFWAGLAVLGLISLVLVKPATRNSLRVEPSYAEYEA